MNETTENFWQTWNTFEWSEAEPVFYRLYYSDNGDFICYTMEDLPGNYIEIDQETYCRGLCNIRILDGKIKVIKTNQVLRKLTPNIKKQGTPCHKDDVCLILPDHDSTTYWSMISNETD
jgi:hypothetical protein